MCSLHHRDRSALLVVVVVVAVVFQTLCLRERHETVQTAALCPGIAVDPSRSLYIEVSLSGYSARLRVRAFEGGVSSDCALCPCVCAVCAFGRALSFDRIWIIHSSFS